jgi:hypothetical protein
MQTEEINNYSLWEAVKALAQLLVVAIIIALLTVMVCATAFFVFDYFLNLLNNPCTFSMGSSRCT